MKVNEPEETLITLTNITNLIHLKYLDIFVGVKRGKDLVMNFEFSFVENFICMMYYYSNRAVISRKILLKFTQQVFQRCFVYLWEILYLYAILFGKQIYWVDGNDNQLLMLITIICMREYIYLEGLYVLCYIMY